jgi:hypothetical protein
MRKAGVLRRSRGNDDPAAPDGRGRGGSPACRRREARRLARLEGDGTAALVLAGRFGTVSATLDGRPVAVDRVPEGISIPVDLAGAGTHDLAVRPRG